MTSCYLKNVEDLTNLLRGASISCSVRHSIVIFRLTALPITVK